MTLRTVLDNLAAALASDTSIAAWCEANFGRGHRVFRGVDFADPPRESDCPVIAISTRERGRDDAGHYYLHGIVVSCAIVSSGTTTAGNVVSYDGLDLLNEFAAMAERVATLHLLSLSVPVVQPAEIADQVAFPWFVAHWAYQLQLRDILS